MSKYIIAKVEQEFVFYIHFYSNFIPKIRISPVKNKKIRHR
ncbi:hypothetical protein DSUL_30069 [Desulfovibrionales bacterium]